MKEICDIWDLGDFLKECEEKRRLRAESLKKGSGSGKRKREDDVNEMDVTYNRRHYGDLTPKVILFAWTRKQGLEQPFYESIENEERVFNSIVTVNGEKYTSSSGDKSKKSSEQLAALVCLRCLGVDDMKVRS